MAKKNSNLRLGEWWSYEKQGIPVRRELENSFLWFTGNGVENIFREVY